MARFEKSVVVVTRSLALERGEKGVRVNAVNSSLNFTDLTDATKNDAGLMARFADRISMDHEDEPQDIADVIAFLASHDARFATGVDLPIDGGLSTSNGKPRQA